MEKLRLKIKSLQVDRLTQRMKSLLSTFYISSSVYIVHLKSFLSASSHTTPMASMLLSSFLLYSFYSPLRYSPLLTATPLLHILSPICLYLLFLPSFTTLPKQSIIFHPSFIPSGALSSTPLTIPPTVLLPVIHYPLSIIHILGSVTSTECADVTDTEWRDEDTPTEATTAAKRTHDSDSAGWGDLSSYLSFLLLLVLLILFFILLLFFLFFCFFFIIFLVWKV